MKQFPRSGALLIVLLTSATFAEDWVKQPTWKVDGINDADVEEFFVTPTTWAIQEPSGRIAYSLDQGKSWNEIKAPTGLPFIAIEGPAIFAKSEYAALPDSMCVFDATNNRWIPSPLPQLPNASSSLSTSGGWGQNYRIIGSNEDTTWIYQSEDTARTWKETARIIRDSLPSPIALMSLFEASNTKIWYQSMDDSLFFLSSDGKVWDSIIAPNSVENSLLWGTYNESQEAFAIVEEGGSELPKIEFTRDSGKTWIESSFEDPGNPLFYMPLANNQFASYSIRIDESDKELVDIHLSGSSQGPWILLPRFGYPHELGDVVDGKLYGSRDDGIYALTLPTVGLQARTSLASTLRASVQAGSIVVSGAQPGAWELLDAQGRRALAGSTREARFTIAAPGRGMWIVRVGQQRTVVMVP